MELTSAQSQALNELPDYVPALKKPACEDLALGDKLDADEARLATVETGLASAEVQLLGGSVDGLANIRVARATYDFAEHGGAIGTISLGVTIPDNAIIIGGMYDVVTTFQTAGADAGTIALTTGQGAGDLVAAIAVSDGSNPWDAGMFEIVPKVENVATFIKTTAARTLSAVVAGQAVTAGKLVLFVHYVQSD